MKRTLLRDISGKIISILATFPLWWFLWFMISYGALLAITFGYRGLMFILTIVAIIASWLAGGWFFHLTAILAGGRGKCSHLLKCCAVCNLFPLICLIAAGPTAKGPIFMSIGYIAYLLALLQVVKLLYGLRRNKAAAAIGAAFCIIVILFLILLSMRNYKALFQHL